MADEKQQDKPVLEICLEELHSCERLLAQESLDYQSLKRLYERVSRGDDIPADCVSVTIDLDSRSLQVAPTHQELQRAVSEAVFEELQRSGPRIVELWQQVLAIAQRANEQCEKAAAAQTTGGGDVGS